MLHVVGFIKGSIDGKLVVGCKVGDTVKGYCVGFVDGMEVGKVELGITLGYVVGEETLGTKIVKYFFRIFPKNVW